MQIILIFISIKL